MKAEPRNDAVAIFVPEAAYRGERDRDILAAAFVLKPLPQEFQRLPAYARERPQLRPAQNSKNRCDATLAR